MRIQHTPGPWVRVDGPDYAGIYTALRPSSPSIALVARAHDADLIAAAPDLLAICKRILDRGYVSPSIDEERDDHLALAAAIAKATGAA